MKFSQFYEKEPHLPLSRIAKTDIVAFLRDVLNKDYILAQIKEKVQRSKTNRKTAKSSNCSTDNDKQ